MFFLDVAAMFDEIWGGFVTKEAFDDYVTLAGLPNGGKVADIDVLFEI